MLTVEQFAAQIWPHDGVLRGIAVQLNKSSQLMPLLNVQPMKGLIHKFSREESGGGIARRAMNQPFPATARGVAVPDEERIEIAGAHIETDYRQVQVNEAARGGEISRRTRVLGRYVDKQLLRGDGLADGAQIVGLRDRVTPAQTITAAASGAQITLAMLEDLIDRTEDQGSGRFVIAPKTIARRLKRVIVDSASGASVAEVSAGVVSYEGVPIIPAEKDEASNDLLRFDETQGTSNVTASVYCIAPGDGENSGTSILMASNSIELIEEGVRASFYHDQLEVAFGMAVFMRKAAARIKGVLAPV